MPPHTFSLGQRIRELRIKKGLTQIDLAKGLCTSSMISQIESDRARPSYRILMAIADRLDIHLDKLLENIDLNLEVMSRYKMARAMVAAKQYETAIPLLRGLLDERTSFPMTEIQLGLAECYLQTNRFDEAQTLLKDVHHTAVIRGDVQLLTVSFYHLGLLDFQQKKYQVATYNWLRALEQVEKQPALEQDHSLKSNVLTLLGRVHIRMGMLREALHYFQEAASLQHKSDHLQELAQIYLELGQTHHRLNDLERSVEYSERAYAIFHSVEDWVNHAKLDMTFAIYSAESDQNEHIIPCLRAVIDRFHTLGRQEEAGVAYGELAKFHLKFGAMEDAKNAYQMAQHLLPTDHIYHGELHQIRGRISYQCNDWKDAIQWFQQAADAYLEAGELGQWDHALHEAAQIYAEEKEYQYAYEMLVVLRSQKEQALRERGIVL